ncbi:MAG: sugar transferase [Acidimicrobiia bacterium]|nr:sugar transferase [Acidimicrobiia bacterium]
MSSPVRLATDAGAIVIATLFVLDVVAWPILATFLPVLMACRLYAPHKDVTPNTLLGDLPRLLVGSTVAAFVLAALYPNIGGYTLRDAALVSSVTFVILVICRGTMHLAGELLRARGFGARPTLIVGRGPTVAHLVEKIAKHPDLGMRVLGVIADARGDEDDLSLVARPEDLPELVTRHGIEQLVLVPEADHLDFATECFLAVDGFKVNAALVPPLKDFLLSPGGVEHVEGIPLISLGRLSYSPRMMPGKRLIDVIGAALGLLIVSPILAAVAIAIKIEDRGPVFFSQRRAGHRGRYFKMLKFRSMCTDAEKRLADLRDSNDSDGLLFKMRDDPRITRVGRFIRKTSLDELPQLVNVLKGEMSLVGPRALPVEVEHFGDLAIKRLNVRPGCTGFWQVLGRSDITYDEMVKLDLAYIQNWSLWVDVQLMLKTIPVLLLRKGAY